MRPFLSLALLGGLLPMFCFAQSNPTAVTPTETPQSSSTSTTNDPSSAQPHASAKKVWTDDEVKHGSGVSVIGDKRNQKYTMTKPPDAATISKYKTNLQKLQSQLDDTNKQLAAYKDFEEGKPVSQSGRDISHGFSRGPVPEQMAKLEAKKKKLEDQIDDLFDEARKKGIESGMLK